jgi:hypothetical protein
MIHSMRTWLAYRIAVPEPVERYFLQGFHRWHIEWVEVIAVEGIVLPSDSVLLSLQTIVGLSEEVRDHAENSGRVRLVAQPGAVSLDRVAQQYARATTGAAPLTGEMTCDLDQSSPLTGVDSNLRAGVRYSQAAGEKISEGLQ